MKKEYVKVLEAKELKYQASVAILITDKIEIKPKLIRRERKGTTYSSKEKSPPREYCNYSSWA